MPIGAGCLALLRKQYLQTDIRKPRRTTLTSLRQMLGPFRRDDIRTALCAFHIGLRDELTQ